MSRNYKCLTSNEFSKNQFKLVPIRDQDKFAILEWRNEQLEILRQKDLLSEEAQISYFKNVVDKLFEEEKPNQLLFSFLENDKLIGYGGLVHIDWESRVAEVSFLTKTNRNNEANQFMLDWTNYLEILKSIATQELDLNKIFTYAYDLRPQLYDALLSQGFIEEARLLDHVTIKNGLTDVLIHSCFLNRLVFREAIKADAELYFNWANDKSVRENSYNNEGISFLNHVNWFQKKLEDFNCVFYLFIMNGKFAGQVRLERLSNEVIISVSIDEQFRGLGLASKCIQIASNDYCTKHEKGIIKAYIKKGNVSSLKSFIKANFKEVDSKIIQGIPSHQLIFNKYGI